MASTDLSATTRGSAPSSGCPNCGAATHGHYCANCGQETALALPGFRAFMREAAGRYVALDGRLWRTLFALVARPGFLTLEYFAGRRRRYIRPARLFLVLYLLLFAVIGLVNSPVDLSDQVVFVRQDVDDDTREPGNGAKVPPPKGASGKSPSVALKEPAKAGAVAGRGSQAPGSASRPEDEPVPALDVYSDDKGTMIGLDDELNLTFRVNGAEARLPEFFRKRYENFRKLPREEKAERIYSGMLRYGSYAIIMLLPIFALLLKIVYLGSGNRYPGRPRRYAEHLVYSAHLHAFAALVLLLFALMPDWGLVKALLTCWVVYYVVRARGAVYGGRWWAGLLRSIVVAVIYVMLIATAMVGLLAVAALVR